MLGRRLHHTDFGDGTHSEPDNPVYTEQVGKLGPKFVNRSCVACHVNNAGGPIETPVITGQNQDYLLKQLNDFGSGQRKNDVYGRMRNIAGKLTPQERATLARYFQGTL